MKHFQTPELKTVRFAARDILTVSEETETTKPAEVSRTGEITTPPDEFEDD